MAKPFEPCWPTSGFTRSWKGMMVEPGVCGVLRWNLEAWSLPNSVYLECVRDSRREWNGKPDQDRRQIERFDRNVYLAYWREMGTWPAGAD